MTSPRTSRLGGRSVAAIGLLALLSGCAPTGLPSAGTPPPPTPASSDYLDALEHTRSLGTAEVRVEVERERGGAPLVGVGAVALYDGHGSLLWESADGAEFAERSNGKGLYVQDDPPSGPWRSVTGPTLTSPLADPLRGLGDVASPKSHGSEVIDGRPAERYVGRTGATPEQLSLAGLPSGAAFEATADGGTQVEISVWIDDRGRIVRIDRAVVAPDDGQIVAAPVVAARTSTRLADFSRAIDLSTPGSHGG